MSSKTAQHGSIMLALVLVGCYQPPTETQLIRSFTSRRAAFDKLLTMAEADRSFPRISAGEIPPRGMPVSRFNEYKAIFLESGVENGTDWGIPSYPEGLFVIASSEIPIGGKARYMGCAYLPTPPRDVVKRLPITESPFEIHSNSGHRTVFKPLDNHWYLFYASEW
jgi:hypothetical protein